MNWVTAALLAAYIGVCEYRAPSPWQACETRWNWALGVLVPSPVPAMARLLPFPGRRRQQTGPEQSPPA